MKKIICLFTLLLAACSSQPVQQPVGIPVVKMELDAKKLKSLADFQEVIDSLQIAYTYRHGDKAEEARLAKIKRFCK